MIYILALETTSTICSVALFQGDQLLGISELQIEKSHSSHITVLVEQLLQNCQVTSSQLAAVALSGGPGSYTGLRIGSATAKGLCYALNIPLIEISTLHALAQEAIQYTPNATNYLFCPMIDARRMEVYTCILNSTLEEIAPITPVILEETSFQDILIENKIVFFGSGASKFQEIIINSTNATFLPNIKPTTRLMGKLALQKYNQAAFEDVAYYEPFYLKEVYITKSNK
jgi:tRNA threonylcarbamoyladenosine biosynthesis protein TsaB